MLPLAQSCIWETLALHTTRSVCTTCVCASIHIFLTALWVPPLTNWLVKEACSQTWGQVTSHTNICRHGQASVFAKSFSGSGYLPCVKYTTWSAFKKSSLYRLAQDYCFKLLTIAYEVKQQQEALRQIWGKIGLNDARAASWHHNFFIFKLGCPSVLAHMLTMNLEHLDPEAVVCQLVLRTFYPFHTLDVYRAMLAHKLSQHGPCVYTLSCQACPIDTLEHLQSSSVLLSCGLNQHWKKQSSHTAELPVFTYLFVIRLQ